MFLFLRYARRVSERKKINQILKISSYNLDIKIK